MVIHSRVTAIILPASGPSYDASALLWKAAVVAAGGTVSDARLAIVSTLITGLKADSLWTSLDRLWLFAAENSTSALIDLKGLSTATAINSPTFTADQGYAGNGTTNYIRTGYIPNTHGVNYTQNSGAMSCYVRNNRTTTVGLPYIFGAEEANNVRSSYLILAPATNAYSNVNGSGVNNIVLATTQGQHVIVRSGSGTTNQTYYINGLSQVYAGRSATSDTPTTYEIYVGANNRTGSALGYTADQFATFSIGAALDATQASNLSSRINAYMTSLGTNVY